MRAAASGCCAPLIPCVVRAKSRIIVRIGSRRDPAVIYTITARANGALVCDCPGFLTSKHKRCRHTDIVDAARQMLPQLADRLSSESNQ